MDTSSIGRTIRHYRLRAGLTQVELGYRSGIPGNTVARIERGLHLPRVGTLLSLAAGLGIYPDLLLRDGVHADTKKVGKKREKSA